MVNNWGANGRMPMESQWLRWTYKHVWYVPNILQSPSPFISQNRCLTPFRGVSYGFVVPPVLIHILIGLPIKKHPFYGTHDYGTRSWASAEAAPASAAATAAAEEAERKTPKAKAVPTWEWLNGEMRVFYSWFLSIWDNDGKWWWLMINN